MIAGQNITAALRRLVPFSANRQRELNEDDLEFAEPLQQWIGPTVVLDREKRLVIVIYHDKVLNICSAQFS